MKRRVGMRGFTIVETMIVLAVTGALFAMIAVTLSGRQRSNEFTQAANDTRTRIQQVITEIQNGYYPSQSDFHCSAVANLVSLSAATNTNQGSNTDCVFLGKLLQFGPQGSNGEAVQVYPVAGLRMANDVASADPSAMRNGQVDTSTSFPLKYGLRVTKMTANGTAIGAFGVLSSLDSSSPSQSGSQQFDIYSFNDIQLNRLPLTDGTSLLNFSRNPVGGVKICLESGGTDQYALITVGNHASQLSAELEVMSKADNPDCGI